ncbi:MAG: cytochrome c biogenesis protein CcsA [Gemmatales bacterium]|nr:cytochrome c biogenesis protein CcsA [Gemmatales bacterium]MDW8387091.1 cytochrome c biogenesis protein CcsA [Gemmatales bacterium]
MAKSDPMANNRSALVTRLLWGMAALLGLVLAGLSAFLFADLLGKADSLAETDRPILPEYDLSAWDAVPVWDGRIKPLETACEEIVRQITGSSRFDGMAAVRLVLHWQLADDADRWEDIAFLLCDHEPLRREVFAHDPEKRTRPRGKFVTPNDLRTSPGFDALLAEVARQRSARGGKAPQRLSATHLKAEEVAKRLTLYDAVRGRIITRLHDNSLIRGQFVSLSEFSGHDAEAREEMIRRLEGRVPLAANPLRLVCLRGVPGNWWLSVDDLRRLISEPSRWRQVLEQRLAEEPRVFLPPSYRTELEEFENAIRSGQRPRGLDELAEMLAQRRQRAVNQVIEARDLEALQQAAAEAVRTAEERQALVQAAEQGHKDRLDFETRRRLFADRLAEALAETDRKALESLEREALRLAGGGDEAEVQLLAMRYLETRYPRLHAESAEVPMPLADMQAVLSAWDALQAAYRSGDADRFGPAMKQLLATVRQVSDAEAMAEADRLIPYELLLNRLRPFRWAWLTMLAAVALFVVQINTGWKWAYQLGWVLLMMGLIVQAFGFVLRVIVAGRAPVGNMYETVIFVAFLAVIFAAVLELIYRRTAIVLAGSAVSALGLMLADQLPLALDPRISPLAPVLRSNFWLTVHVVTIVASYAGATLAWGLGNVSLGLLAFGRPQQDTLKTLATYTYRAMQIAVVLLALGTVLGAWWASEAWGRYWGWDPKETGAVIALLGYVIPLHARYAGWIREFGLAVSAVLCYAGIILSWYVINFVIAAGLHSYGFGGGGGWWVLWAGLLNIEWVLIASAIYLGRSGLPRTAVT